MIVCTTRVVSRRVLILATLVVTSFFIPASITFANGECGYIYEPSNLYIDEWSVQYGREIINCADPFDVTTDPASPYQLYIDGVAYANNAVVYVPTGYASTIEARGESSLDTYGSKLFKHEGDDYRYMPQQARNITRADFIAHAETYFDNPTDRNFYMEIWDEINTNIRADYYFYNNQGEYVIDTQTGETVLSRYNGFVNSLQLPNPVFTEGTYTLLVTESILINSSRTLLDRFVDLLIPTAHAQFVDGWPENRYTFTFTITNTPPQQGASSILFLPGIQASRLYTEGVFGTEDQLWTPNWNQDVRQLEMNENGDSINQVYTRDILDEVAGLGTVYKNFAHSLDALVADKTIVEWRPFAYDWRYPVDDIVENGTQYENEIRSVSTLVEELAEDSYSKKVTVVAHSNGGLLAKALLTRLGEQGKEHLVDRLILLASPQLGTPKAVGSLLHGFDQSAAGGIVIDAAVARSAIKNMPGAYGLLPTAEYFTEVGVPFIKFTEGTSLQLFRDHYGTDIESVSELYDFLTGVKDGRGEATTVYDAIKVNSDVLQDSSILHTNILQPWRATSTTQVIEVVGVGLPTVSGFEYREFNKRECSTTLFAESCTDVAYYKPVPIFSLYGDETVMAQSAKGYQGNKQTYYFDLFGLRQLGPSNRFRHVNFSEALAIQELVTKSIKNESLENIQFISSSAVVQTSEYQLLSVNSPATVVVLDNEGNKTEIDFSDDELMTKQEGIPNSSIYYMGSTTYVVLPFEKTYNFVITGTGDGGITVVLDTIGNETLSTTHEIYFPDTNQGMKIEGRITNEQMSSLEVDLTNDGVIDYLIDSKTGEKVVESSTKVSKSSSAKTSTKVKNSPLGTVAGISISTDNADLGEYYKKLFLLLLTLQDILQKYEK
jgi:pimeloyl-ACP methyl ester carboxylesterase